MKAILSAPSCLFLNIFIYNENEIYFVDYESKNFWEQITKQWSQQAIDKMEQGRSQEELETWVKSNTFYQINRDSTL